MIYSLIGNACVSARVDKRLAPLQTLLENGMTIEIITTTWARPNPVWLNYVVTAKAQSGIRSYLNIFKQREATELDKASFRERITSDGGGVRRYPARENSIIIIILVYPF